MVGDALLVTPCVHEDATTVKGHFPSGGNTIWRDWYTHEVSCDLQSLVMRLTQEQILKVDENEQAETPAPLGHIPLHLRSGKAIVRHTESKYTLTETKQCPLEVMVSLDREGNAEGQFVMDDGMSLECVSFLDLHLSMTETMYSCLVDNPGQRFGGKGHNRCHGRFHCPPKTSKSGDSRSRRPASSSHGRVDMGEGGICGEHWIVDHG